MRLEYQLTLADYQEADTAHIRARPLTYYGIRALAPVAIAAGIFHIMFSEADVTHYVFIAGGVWFIFLITVRRFRLARAWKTRPELRDPVTLEAREDALLSQTPTIESKISWQAYTHFVETTNLFLLYVSPVEFQIVPKRAFNDAVQIDQFRKLLIPPGQKPALDPPIPHP